MDIFLHSHLGQQISLITKMTPQFKRLNQSSCRNIHLNLNAKVNISMIKIKEESLTKKKNYYFLLKIHKLNIIVEAKILLKRKLNFIKWKKFMREPVKSFLKKKIVTIIFQKILKKTKIDKAFGNSAFKPKNLRVINTNTMTKLFLCKQKK